MRHEEEAKDESFMKRREFIKGAGLVATTAYVGPGNKAGNNSPIRAYAT